MIAALDHSLSQFTMAPKASGSGKEKAVTADDEEVLQAVILADSFNKRFKPLTSNRPRVSSHSMHRSLWIYKVIFH